MFEKREFWYFLMFGAVVLWILSFWLSFLLFPESTIGKAVFPLALFVLHLSEVPLSSKIGKSKGISKLRVVLNTLLFGFTWWLPLKRGVLD
jgi:hypothetical protein